MIDIEDKTEYTFRYIDCEGKTYTSQFENPGPTWMECLDDFVSFLESVYKHDIRSKIRLSEDQCLKIPHEYLDPWTGEYFSKEETEEKDTGEKYAIDW